MTALRPNGTAAIVRSAHSFQVGCCNKQQQMVQDEVNGPSANVEFFKNQAT